MQTSASRKGALGQQINSIGRMSMSSSSTEKKDDMTSLEFIYQSTNKSKRRSHPSSHASSYNKRFSNVSAFETFLNEMKNYDTKKKSNSGREIRTRKPLGVINDFSNRKKLFQENDDEKKSAKNSKKKESNKSSNKKLCANKYFEFQNEVTHKVQCVKKFKEDEIEFTKSNILPEIQWQKIDNDVLTSDDQKQKAYRKEMNWLTETVRLIQGNDKYLKNHLFMSKMSKKFPSGI